MLSCNLFDAAIMKTCVIGPEFRDRYLSNPDDSEAFEGPVVVLDGLEDYHARIDDPALGITDLAAHFGVSRQALSTLLNGNASLSADMAIRFEKAFGVRADTLLRMQTAFELAQARAHEDEIKVRKFAEAA